MNKIFIDDVLFSNLRFHNENLIDLLKKILEWDDKLNKTTYTKFVQSVSTVCDKILYNEGSVFYEVKISLDN